ncbi:MAG: hypothetical protein FWD83_07545 [Promicromonosporaceae bacterium]|nr:hypothetical protein [Promicromonosporaceae bacterium]
MTMRRKISASLLALLTGATMMVATAPSAQAAAGGCPALSVIRNGGHANPTSATLVLHASCTGGFGGRPVITSTTHNQSVARWGIWRRGAMEQSTTPTRPASENFLNTFAEVQRVF